jgi:hypothetical protein
MAKMEANVKRAQAHGLAAAYELSVAEFSRLEAEQWLAEAKAK